MRIAIWAFLSILASCTKYDLEKCDDLSMKKYQGRPKESREYDDNCKDKVDHPITQTVCQKALEFLIISGSEDKIKKAFGPNIMGCFTGDDLKRFLR